MVVKFRRYGVKPLDIRHYVQDKQCNCRGPFHRCRNTDLLSALRGCKCDFGRMKQMSEFCCDDPRITDVELLIDSGFEVQADEDIPAHFSAPIGEGWGQATFFTPAYFNKQWYARTLSPDAGSKHAWAHFSAGAGGDATNWIEPIRKRDCVYNLGYSAIVQQGDLVVWSVRGKVSQLTGAPESRLMINFHASNWADIFPVPGTVTSSLSTSYATYSSSAIAPAGAKFCRVFWWPRTTGSHSDTEWFMDTCSLVVS